MATYPVVNKQTGEQKNVVMSVHDWNKWLEDNPDWHRDWSDPSTAPMATDVGEWRDKLVNNIQDGMKSSTKHRKHQKQLLRRFKHGKKKKSICKG